MANLVNLLLDLETGEFVTGDPVTGGGGGAGAGYVHTQLTPATTWTIVHAKNSQNLIYQIYDSTNENIIPDTFKIIDNNTVEVTFSVAQAGKANIVLFSL